jgi:hypothetical protein
MIQLSLFPQRGYGLLGLPGLVEDWTSGEPLFVRSRCAKRLTSALKELDWGSPRVVRLERHQSPGDEIPTFVIAEVTQQKGRRR